MDLFLRLALRQSISTRSTQSSRYDLHSEAELSLKSAVEVLKCSAAVMSFYCALLSTSLASRAQCIRDAQQPTVHLNYYLHLCALTVCLTSAAAEKLQLKAALRMNYICYSTGERYNDVLCLQCEQKMYLRSIKIFLGKLQWSKHCSSTQSHSKSTDHNTLKACFYYSIAPQETDRQNA